MSYLPHLFALLGVWVVVTITPGPDFAVTLRYATARSRRDGVFVALGVTAGLTIWITGSMAGLGILFAHFSWLVEIIRTLGALYLAYLGISMILTAHRLPTQLAIDGVPTRRFSVWRIGFLSNLSNPKLAAFFSSLFAALLASARQRAALGARSNGNGNGQHHRCLAFHCRLPGRAGANRSLLPSSKTVD